MHHHFPFLCGVALFVLLSITSEYSSQFSLQRAFRSLSSQHTAPNLLGILVVGRADIYTIKAWLHRHINIFNKLVIIDGSYNDLVTNEAKKYKNAVVLTEDTLNIATITDQTLRAPAMSVLGNPIGSWIMICHADEFWTIDPRRLVHQIRKKGKQFNLIRLGVLTASPLESEYNMAVKRLANEKNYLEDNFHIMDVSNLTYNRNSRVNRVGLRYFENRLFRWEKGMQWGVHDHGVVPGHNPKGYIKSKKKNAFYVHFKLHDFSPNALSRGSHLANSHLHTGLHNFTHEGWMGSFLDESFPVQLDQYPPRTIESALERLCKNANPRWPCELPWTVDASFK